MKIYQHVDEFNDRDGIGNDILGFDALFKNLSFYSAVIARINNSKTNLEVYSPSKPPKFFQNDIHILHFGGSGYPIDFFQDLSGKKILRFHNMTPVSFFQDFIDDDIFKTFEKNEIKSNLELYSLHRSISTVLFDSSFNKSEYLKLVDDTYNLKMYVMPVIRHYPLNLKKKENKSFRIGFLGRWAPNKKLEDLLLVLYFLNKINPAYKLVLIGRANPIFQKYADYIHRLILELGLQEKVEILENLSDKEVELALSNLDVYLSMSEHEGFGIPILEAMGLGVPVLAFSSTAIKETVTDVGILFTQKDFPKIAELIHKVITSPSLITKLRESQFKRVKAFNEFPYEKTLLSII